MVRSPRCRHRARRAAHPTRADERIDGAGATSPSHACSSPTGGGAGRWARVVRCTHRRNRRAVPAGGGAPRGRVLARAARRTFRSGCVSEREVLHGSVRERALHGACVQADRTTAATGRVHGGSALGFLVRGWPFRLVRSLHSPAHPDPQGSICGGSCAKRDHAWPDRNATDRPSCGSAAHVRLADLEVASSPHPRTFPSRHDPTGTAAPSRAERIVSHRPSRAAHPIRRSHDATTIDHVPPANPRPRPHP